MSALSTAWKAALHQGSANSALTGTVKIAAIGAGYTFNAAHDFYDDVSAEVLGTPQTLASKAYSGRYFDADNVTFAGINDPIQGFWIYIDTGTAGTSRLVAWLDDESIPTLPTDPGGLDYVLNFNALGIFGL